jgi:hypothetical protein
MNSTQITCEQAQTMGETVGPDAGVPRKGEGRSHPAQLTHQLFWIRRKATREPLSALR